MTEARHSPTPWHACGENRGGCPCGFIWSADGNGLICRAINYTHDAAEDEPAPDVDTAIANAQHIVRCVNAHAGLVAACRAALVRLEELNEGRITATEMLVRDAIHGLE